MLAPPLNEHHPVPGNALGDRSQPGRGAAHRHLDGPDQPGGLGLPALVDDGGGVAGPSGFHGEARVAKPGDMEGPVEEEAAPGAEGLDDVPSAGGSRAA
jgi:hypothetical protein